MDPSAAVDVAAALARPPMIDRLLAQPVRDGEESHGETAATDEAAELRLMVIDDDDEARAIIRDAFEEDGWNVTEASGGARALALLRSPPFPDVVVLDLVMPGLDGFAVLSELRDARGIKDVPIVVLSSKRAGLASRIAGALGADDCITKPVDTGVLRTRCAALLAARADVV